MITIRSGIIILSIIFFGTIFYSQTLNKSEDVSYKIKLVGDPIVSTWEELEGRYPIIAITNKERWPYVEALSKKINTKYYQDFKGVFLIDYSGEEYDFFSKISGKNKVWLLDSFDGSHYALYPFTKIPAYYYIDNHNIAHGPFYKRGELLQKALNS